MAMEARSKNADARLIIGWVRRSCSGIVLSGYRLLLSVQRDYFEGQTDALGTVPVQARGTSFQDRVWGALRGIPAGEIISYRTLAERVGQSGAARAVGNAVRDAATLKYMDGGHGGGCSSRDDGPSNVRRVFHQVTMYGFLLCFASTTVATVYDYGLGLVAPYPVFSLPVLLGTIGGIGLIVGPIGLIWVKITSDSRPMQVRHYGMDYAFLVLLLAISVSGLLLLGVRETAAMGVALTIHLGFVLAFFITLPYSKFVHAVYRFAALIRFSREKGSYSE